MEFLSIDKFKNITVTFLVIGLLWIGVSTQLPGGTSSAANPAPQRGFSAPEFSLQTPDGETYTLSELQGRPVLVNLWASWCTPCRREMPAMERMYQEFKDDGFIVLAVNATNQDSINNATAFVEQLGLTFPILLDINGEVSDLYQLRALPSSFFIDSNGIIQEVVIGGPMAEVLLRTRVENLLEGTP